MFCKYHNKLFDSITKPFDTRNTAFNSRIINYNQFIIFINYALLEFHIESNEL